MEPIIFFLLFLFSAIVKDGEQFVMAANYRGFLSRRQHQTGRLSAFVAGGRQADQSVERPMHTAALHSSLNALLYVINGPQSDRQRPLLHSNDLAQVKETRPLC